jgi:plastocyanin
MLGPGAAGTADAHPGHGPAVVSIQGYAFRPSTFTLYPGDVLQWSWDGLDTNHSVTADSGAFDSDPGEAPAAISHPRGDFFAYQFNKLGTFTYHCRVHGSMRGTVVVVPAPAGTPGVDTVAPRLDRVALRPRRACRTRSARCAHPGTKLSYRVSEAVDLSIRLRRGSRTRRSFFRASRKGTRATSLSLRGLAPGRYTVVVQAIDVADNRSRAHSLALTVV